MDLFSKCKELYEKIRYFEYGIPVDGVIKPVPSPEYFVKNYHFLEPEEFEKYKGGICWDYVEYERKFLEVNDIDFNQYYLITNTPPNYDTHTFITVKDGDELIYIESSFKRVEHIIDGVQKFKSLEDIVRLITTNMWYCNDNDKHFDEFKYDVCKFKGHPKYGCTCQEYMDWMDENSDIVIQDVAINPKKVNEDELAVEEFSVNKIDTKFNQFVCETVNDHEEYDEALHDHINDEDDIYNESFKSDMRKKNVQLQRKNKVTEMNEMKQAIRKHVEHAKDGTLVLNAQEIDPKNLPKEIKFTKNLITEIPATTEERAVKWIKRKLENMQFNMDLYKEAEKEFKSTNDYKAKDRMNEYKELLLNDNNFLMNNFNFSAFEFTKPDVKETLMFNQAIRYLAELVNKMNDFNIKSKRQEIASLLGTKYGDDVVIMAKAGKPAITWNDSFSPNYVDIRLSKRANKVYQDADKSMFIHFSKYKGLTELNPGVKSNYGDFTKFGNGKWFYKNPCVHFFAFRMGKFGAHITKQHLKQLMDVYGSHFYVYKPQASDKIYYDVMETGHSSSIHVHGVDAVFIETNKPLPVKEYSVDVFPILNDINRNKNSMITLKESYTDPEEYDEALHDHIDDEDDVYNESSVLKFPKKVNNVPFDIMYFGSNIDFGNESIKLDHNELFLTPYIGLASIFITDRKEYFKPLPKDRPHNTNIGYDEWGLSPSELQKPLKEVHVSLDDIPNVTPFEFDYTGYIYAIDVSQYKDNLYQKDWMTSDREFILKDINPVPIKEKIKWTHHVYVRGKEESVNESCVQRGRNLADPDGVMSGSEKSKEELEQELAKYIKTINESWTDFKNGVHPSSGLMFHVSLKNDMDGKTINPQLPSYITDGGELDDNYQEDTKTKRLCVSPSIEGCLIAILSYNKIREHVGDKFYVYTPEKPFSQYKHKTNKEIVKDKLVFDANITKEAWILEPCKLKLYGIIKLKKVKDLKKKPTVEKNIKMNTIKLDYEWIMTPKASGKFNKMIGDSPNKEDDKKEKPIKEYDNILVPNDEFFMEASKNPDIKARKRTVKNLRKLGVDRAHEVDNKREIDELRRRMDDLHKKYDNKEISFGEALDQELLLKEKIRSLERGVDINIKDSYGNKHKVKLTSDKNIPDAYNTIHNTINIDPNTMNSNKFDSSFNHEAGHAEQNKRFGLYDLDTQNYNLSNTDDYPIKCAKLFLQKNKDKMNSHDTQWTELHADFLSCKKSGFGKMIKDVYSFKKSKKQVEDAMDACIKYNESYCKELDDLYLKFKDEDGNERTLTQKDIDECVSAYNQAKEKLDQYHTTLSGRYNELLNKMFDGRLSNAYKAKLEKLLNKLEHRRIEISDKMLTLEDNFKHNGIPATNALNYDYAMKKQIREYNDNLKDLKAAFTTYDYRIKFMEDMYWIHKGHPGRCSMKYPPMTPEDKKYMQEADCILVSNDEFFDLTE